MSVALEFIDFIVPIHIIRQKYPGGWQKCLEDHKNLIGGRIWYDEHLFRDGAMSPMDIEALAEEWESLGFTGIVEVDGQQHFQDFCVVESLFGGSTLTCPWLAFDDNDGAYFASTEPGVLMDRESFKSHRSF